MFDNFCYYFLIFIIYSFMGWLMEIIDNIIVKHKIVNRGLATLRKSAEEIVKSEERGVSNA